MVHYVDIRMQPLAWHVDMGILNEDVQMARNHNIWMEDMLSEKLLEVHPDKTVYIVKGSSSYKNKLVKEILHHGRKGVQDIPWPDHPLWGSGKKLTHNRSRMDGEDKGCDPRDKINYRVVCHASHGQPHDCVGPLDKGLGPQSDLGSQNVDR